MYVNKNNDHKINLNDGNNYYLLLNAYHVPQMERDFHDWSYWQHSATNWELKQAVFTIDSHTYSWHTSGVAVTETLWYKKKIEKSEFY